MFLFDLQYDVRRVQVLVRQITDKTCIDNTDELIH